MDASNSNSLLTVLKPPAELPINIESLSPHFARVARQLLSSFALVVGHERFRLREIEFYVAPLDPFAHGERDQDRNGGWYFHQRGNKEKGGGSSSSSSWVTVGVDRGVIGDSDLDTPSAGSPDSWKRNFTEGTRKGLDLAFSAPGIRGGVLIRTIETIPSSETISGPSLVVEKLASILLTGHPQFNEMKRAGFRGAGVARALVQDVLLDPLHNPPGLDASDPRNILRLEQSSPSDTNLRIHASPRIGMSLKKLQTTTTTNPELALRMLRFFAANWRFVSEPLQDLGKGIGNTVLGVVKEVIGKGDKREKEVVDEVVALTGCNKTVVQGILREYRSGKVDGERAVVIAGNGGTSGSNPELEASRPTKRRKLDPPNTASQAPITPPQRLSPHDISKLVKRSDHGNPKSLAWCVGWCEGWCGVD